MGACNSKANGKPKKGLNPDIATIDVILTEQNKTFHKGRTSDLNFKEKIMDIVQSFLFRKKLREEIRKEGKLKAIVRTMRMMRY